MAIWHTAPPAASTPSTMAAILVPAPPVCAVSGTDASAAPGAGLMTGCGSPAAAGKFPCGTSGLSVTSGVSPDVGSPVSGFSALLEPPEPPEPPDPPVPYTVTGVLSTRGV